MLKGSKSYIFIGLLLIVFAYFINGRVDFFLLNQSADKYSRDFLQDYKESLPNSNPDVIKEQSSIYIEAYNLLLDNYIYEINNVEKEEILSRSREALRSTIEKIQEDNQEELTPQSLMQGVMNSVFNDIDAHTVYIDSLKSDSFRESLKGNRKGIGVMFTFDKQKEMIYITQVLSNSPADSSGLQKGDYIKAVNGEDIDASKSLQDIVSSIRGENGTLVTLTIVRGSTIFDIDIIRGDYNVPSVESRIIDQNYAYIKINNFNQETAAAFRADINSLQINTLNGMIIDVRNNPGGLLTAVVLIADNLLEGDTIVSIKGRNKSHNQDFLSFKKTQVRSDIPIVVLTNSASASASELLAGAIAINGRGIIMGDYTFGKWTVQSSFTLQNKSIFNVTTQVFYAPRNATFQGDGLAPDIHIVGDNKQPHFRESNYDNFLQVEDIYERKPQHIINEKQCPIISNGQTNDYILGCAVMYLQFNANMNSFINNLRP